MEPQQSKINPTSPMNQEPPRREYQEPQGRIMGGLIIVAVGGVLLARQTGVDLPYWLFNFEMLIIVIGVFIGAKTGFRDSKWLIPVVIGTALLLNNHFYDFHLSRYFWPLIIIGIGLFVMIRAKRPRRRGEHSWEDPFTSAERSSENAIESVTFFGGVKKNVIAKDFKGGEIVTVFGGTELNLMQADTKDRIYIEVVQIFGGTKLLVPPHWKIQTEELVTIFGGLTDKRPMPSTPVEDSKVLVLKGVCIFGGIDIKSF